MAGVTRRYPAPGSGRYQAAAKRAESRTKRHCQRCAAGGPAQLEYSIVPLTCGPARCRREIRQLGAVKGSQLDLFSTVINWFIRYGHEASGVDPIDPS